MKKNASVLLALTGILLLLGCELITNIPTGRPSIENPLEDTWTELTVENIDTEIEKYDGTFIGEVEGVPPNSNEIQKFTWILVIIAKNKTMGVLWGTEVQFDPNNFPQGPMTEFMESSAAQKARMIGNGGNKIKIFLPQEDDKPVEVILTKQ